MDTTTNRGRVAVHRDSWMWRWYAAWSRRKGDTRRVVDLCHFMRVLLIFGPWRWFWDWNLRIPPFIATGIVLITGAIVALFLLFTPVMTFIAVAAGIILAMAAVIVGAGILLARWIHLNPDRFDRFMDAVLNGLGAFFCYGFIWLWWPAMKLAQGAAWVAFRTVIPAGERVFGKPLFYLPFRGSRYEVWIYPILFTIAYIAWFTIYPVPTAIVTGCILVIGLLAIGAVVGVHKVKAWQATRETTVYFIDTGDEYVPVKEKKTKPKREWRTLKLFWQFLVAKKHRVCPLIEPVSQDPEFEQPKTPTFV